MSVQTVNPRVESDGTVDTDGPLWPLIEFLLDRYYPLRARYAIVQCAARTRCLQDAIDLIDREDLDDAYTVLESCFPPVGSSAADWDGFSEMDRWVMGPPIRRDAELVPPDLDLEAEAAMFWPGQG
jgi:hypothetical protein